MGWPDLTYRSRLEPELRNELEQLVALVIGWNSTEHGPDGRHTTITIEGMQFRGPNGDILATITLGPNGIVITYPPQDATPPFPATGPTPITTLTSPAQISNLLIGALGLSTSGGSDTAFAAIEFQTNGAPGGSAAAVAHRWLAVTGRDTLGQYWALGDRTASDYGVKLYFQPGIGYSLAPPINANPNAYRLGDRTAPPLLWHEVNARQVYARDGYLERSRTVPMGEWSDVPYDAANFTGSGGMIVTVQPADQVSYAYTIVGRTMTVAMTFAEIGLSGVAGQYIFIKLPGGVVPATREIAAVLYGVIGGSVWGVLTVQARVGDPNLWVSKLDKTTWPLTAGGNYIFGSISFSI